MYIPNRLIMRKNREAVKKFIDFDKNDQLFYDNLFLDEENIVIKIPLTNNDNSSKNVKIERFSLANHTFLTSY
ncbi:MAG: hypothetical protein EU548_03475 [Promethearchaeota archaeon]|nr:MAG: hypothetical protein EU548_03475 [Candidatus Lokiarchaeota archaeon]